MVFSHRRAARVASRHRGSPLRVLAWLGFLLAVYVAAAGAARAGDGPTPPAPPPPPSPATTPGAGSDESSEESPKETQAPDTAPSEGPDAVPMRLVPESVEVSPPPPGLLRGWFGLCHPDPCLSPFWRDTDVRLHLRTFYFDRHNVDESINEAWALGGWLQYTSGWLHDVFQVGATLYTSQPLYAPEDHDGTTLLEPGQDPITVLGQAYARLRYCDDAVLTVYRQSVNDGYIGPQDNRMIPNTFEGVTLRGDLGQVLYDTGYLWDMKPRNRDEFLSMSEQAGAGGDDGVLFGSITWKPNGCWEAFGGDYYTPDVFNTAFGYVKYVRRISACTELQAGLQYTDQRSVGDERLGSFETWNVGVGGRLVWDWGLTLGAAFHATSDDAGIKSPYGTWPGWLSLIETDFDRANEKAFGFGLRYDFGKGGPLGCAPGLLAVLAWAHGADREDPGTGAHLPDTDEFDFDLTYDVQRVKGLQLRFRNAYVDAGGPDTGWQIRLIVNWEIDLL